jgi:putative ABC transport system substrate-binding protein
MVLDVHFHEGALDRLDDIAPEFVARKSSIIFASNPYAIRVAKKMTEKIPIIGVDLESDPVASGLVKSLARPGGNFTGFFLDIPDLGGKQIELIMEAVSPLSRLAVIWEATIGEVQFRATEMARRPSGVNLKSLPIERAEDFHQAFQGAVSERAQGVILLSSPLIFLQRPQIAELALKARMPTISLFTSFPRACGVSASSSEVSAPVALIPSSDA